MSKRKRIDTSIAAFRSLDQSKVEIIKGKIMEALKVLGRGSSEQLADYLGMDYDSVWKRCSDLKNDKKIFASDSKVLTRKKRFARQWMICDGSLPKTEKSQKELKGQKSISDFSKEILKNKPGYHQAALFIDNI